MASFCWTFANVAEPDQVLHCLLTEMNKLINTNQYHLNLKWTCLIDKDGQFILVKWYILFLPGGR